MTDGHIAFRGSISPRFRGCNSRKVVSGPYFAGVSRRMRASIHEHLSSSCVSPASPPPPPPPPSSPPVLLSTRLFSFPLISVRCSRLFIAGVHTISRRTLTAPTTSSSAGNYRIIAEKLLGLSREPRDRRSLIFVVGTEGKRRERNAGEYFATIIRDSQRSSVGDPLDDDVRDIVRAILENIITLITIFICLLHMLTNRSVRKQNLTLIKTNQINFY